MDKCGCCGFPVQDGRRFCPVCDGTAEPDFILKDGTPVYLEMKTNIKPCSEQLELYQMLFRKG